MNILTNAAQDFDVHAKNLQSRRDMYERNRPINIPAAQFRPAVKNDGDRQVELLEKHVVALKDLLEKQRYDSLIAETERLTAMRDEIKKLLEEYKATGDKDLKNELMDRIAAMKEKIAELTRKLAEMSKDLPEEFMNVEAMQKSAMKELEDVEQKVRDGELDQALAELEDMAKNLEKMLGDMNKDSDKLQEDLYGEQMKQLQEFSKDVKQLEEAQNALKKDNDEMLSKYREELDKLMKEKLDRLADELARKAKQAKKDLEEADIAGRMDLDRNRKQAVNDLDGLSKLLDNKDLGTSMEMARKALDSIEAMDALTDPTGGMRPDGKISKKVKSARKATEEIVEKLSNAMPDPQTVLGKEDGQKIDKMSGEQGKLSMECMGAERKLSEMMKQSPLLGPDMPGAMRGASESMQQAGFEQGARRLSPASDRQQTALHRLGQVQEGLQEAMKQMQKPGQRQGGRGGGREFAQDKVAIPDAGQFKTPEELRKDILDAMKVPGPEKYEDQNKSYYRGLVDQ